MHCKHRDRRSQSKNVEFAIKYGSVFSSDPREIYPAYTRCCILTTSVTYASECSMKLGQYSPTYVQCSRTCTRLSLSITEPFADQTATRYLRFFFFYPDRLTTSTLMFNPISFRESLRRCNEVQFEERVVTFYQFFLCTKFLFPLSFRSFLF